MAERMRLHEFSGMLNSDIWTEADNVPKYTIITLNHEPWYACWLMSTFTNWDKR